MGLRLIRKPSTTPNINVRDDTKFIRHAYGGYKGYVPNFGNELDYEINGLNFKILSGTAVIDGYEVEIDSNGSIVTLDRQDEKKYVVVYLEIDLATNTVQTGYSYSISTYPDVPLGDDLTQNSTGIARLPLYKFTVTGDVISDITKVVQKIPYLLEKSLDLYNFVIKETGEIRDDVNDFKNSTNEKIDKKAGFPNYLTSSDTEYPVGSIIIADAFLSGVDMQYVEKPNSEVFVTVFADGYRVELTPNYSGWTYLAGIWRTRGSISVPTSDGSYHIVICQRVIQ